MVRYKCSIKEQHLLLFKDFFGKNINHVYVRYLVRKFQGTGPFAKEEKTVTQNFRRKSASRSLGMVFNNLEISTRQFSPKRLYREHL